MRCSALAGRVRQRTTAEAERGRPEAAWLDGGMPPYDAFLLVSFGGPEGPEDVIPFLRNVTARPRRAARAA